MMNGRMSNDENIDSIATTLFEINKHLENFILIYSEIHGKPLEEYSLEQWKFKVKP